MPNFSATKQTELYSYLVLVIQAHLILEKRLTRKELSEFACKGALLVAQLTHLAGSIDLTGVVTCALAYLNGEGHPKRGAL